MFLHFTPLPTLISSQCFTKPAFTKVTNDFLISKLIWKKKLSIYLNSEQHLIWLTTRSFRNPLCLLNFLIPTCSWFSSHVSNYTATLSSSSSACFVFLVSLRAPSSSPTLLSLLRQSSSLGFSYNPRANSIDNNIY